MAVQLVAQCFKSNFQDMDKVRLIICWLLYRRKRKFGGLSESSSGGLVGLSVAQTMSTVFTLLSWNFQRKFSCQFARFYIFLFCRSVHSFLEGARCNKILWCKNKKKLTWNFPHMFGMKWTWLVHDIFFM
jgi:hypothetical protein